MSEEGDCVKGTEISEEGDSVRVDIKSRDEPNAEMPKADDSVTVDIRRMLVKISSYDASNHNIARVPDFLRRENAEAYDPRIVSIGPIHHDKNHVKNMEEHKVWYLEQLLQRIKDKRLEDYTKALGELEEKARTYYSSLLVLPPKDVFVKMLLLDGVFVIELARKWSFRNLVDSKDYIFQFTKGDSKDEDDKDHCNEELIQIRRDMLMIENQLPFFILRELFEMTKPEDSGDDLFKMTKAKDSGDDLSEAEDSGDELYHLLLKFFRRVIPGRPDVVSNKIVDNGVYPDHLLGLVYNAYFVDKTIGKTHNNKKFKFDEINSASELHEEGIKFKRLERAETTSLMNVKFKDGVMKIPKLEVGDVTESLFRNLIAYELIPFDDKHSSKPRYVTEYCFLMQFLVNSKKDVEILRRAGIVTNWMGDDEMVRHFFNKLTKNVASSQDFYYANIIRSMNKYCDQWCNLKKWWTIFVRKYINSPWSITSVLAAMILLLMTATNISFAILSYKIKREDKKLH